MIRPAFGTHNLRTIAYIEAMAEQLRLSTATWEYQMIFGMAEIVRYLSQFMVLDPGDIINTGTPPGVALGQPDKPYLRPGDVVELGIGGLGTQRQRFVAAP